MNISKTRLKQIIMEEIKSNLANKEKSKPLTKSDIAKIIYEEAARAIQEETFTGGQINIEPLSDEEQEAAHDAYYALHGFFRSDAPQLPGTKPSEKMIYALRWIAKFEGGMPSGPDSATTRTDPYNPSSSADGSRSLEEGVVDMDGETIVTGPDGDASPEARGLARQDDLQTTMMKAAMEIKDNNPQKAYETLLRALAAAGIEGGEALPGLDE